MAKATEELIVAMQLAKFEVFMLYIVENWIWRVAPDVIRVFSHNWML